MFVSDASFPGETYPSRILKYVRPLSSRRIATCVYSHKDACWLNLLNLTVSQPDWSARRVYLINLRLSEECEPRGLWLLTICPAAGALPDGIFNSPFQDLIFWYL